MSREQQQQILTYWFGETRDAATVMQDKRELWFKKSKQTDRYIEDTFGSLVNSAADGSLDAWTETSEGLLAVVILLDQFRRNIFRDRPECFSHDAKALALSKQALQEGRHKDLTPIEKMFLYMPFMHSENVEDQDLCVRLFTELVDGAAAEEKRWFMDSLDYAERHRVIIERFGRFPHRNVILGRPSTAEELAFLEEPGSSF